MVTAFHTTEGFREAVDAARDLDAFTDEHLDSEYTRGIVELIVHAFMQGNDDAGDGDRHEYVRRVGRLGARRASTLGGEPSMDTVVGVWLHDEPLPLAMFAGEHDAIDAEDHEYADMQTWVTTARTLREAAETMRASRLA